MDLTPGPAEDQERSEEKPLGLLELIPDEAERGQLWANVWEEYDAAYNEWRDNNPGWKAFYTAHHSYALDAALAVFGEALTSAAYRAGREDAAKAIEAVLTNPEVTYSLNNANDLEVRAGLETVRAVTPMMTETAAIRAALAGE